MKIISGIGNILSSAVMKLLGALLSICTSVIILAAGIISAVLIFVMGVTLSFLIFAVGFLISLLIGVGVSWVGILCAAYFLIPGPTEKKVRWAIQQSEKQ